MPAEIRAAQVKENLDALASLGERAADVRNALSVADVAAVEGASRLHWLPLRIDVAITETVARVCGTDAMREWSRVTIRRTLSSPLIQPIVSGAVQIFGVSPAAFYRVFAKGWGAVYRGCGDLSVVDVASDRCAVQWRAPPPEVSDVYLEGVGASLVAILEVTLVKGAVAVHRTTDTARLELTWTAIDPVELRRRR